MAATRKRGLIEQLPEKIVTPELLQKLFDQMDNKIDKRLVKIEGGDDRRHKKVEKFNKAHSWRGNQIIDEVETSETEAIDRKLERELDKSGHTGAERESILSKIQVHHRDLQ